MPPSTIAIARDPARLRTFARAVVAALVATAATAMTAATLLSSGCRAPTPPTNGASRPATTTAPAIPGTATHARDATIAPLDRAALLECLGAPADAMYAPEDLTAPPEPGLGVHTFTQETSRCGTVVRRYVAYVPPALGPRTGSPVLLVLHGQGASAEAMMEFQTRRGFNALASEHGFVVVYGNGLPTTFNFAGLPNSGRWRTEDGDAVDDAEYLRRVVGDLVARGVVAGGNDVVLVGQSNGGGMALRAATQDPDAYTGVAAFMPYVGRVGSPPPSLLGTRLRRVLFAYSVGDPGLPPGYTTRVLAPLAEGWARALGIPASDIASPVDEALPDLVREGSGDPSDVGAAAATRDSTVIRVDWSASGRAERLLVFDHAGHFWPVREYADPARVIARFGLRNQDVDGAEETWRFFREGRP